MLQNKFTPYYFGCYAQSANFGLCVSSGPNANSGLYGPDNPVLSPSKIFLDDRFNNTGAAPFLANVTCGKIKVQMYGQAGPSQDVKVPVPVSVGTSPLLDRASWVQPPYDGGECTP